LRRHSTLFYLIFFLVVSSKCIFFLCVCVRKMFKQLVKINVGARNLKRKKNIPFFLFLGPSCELHFFWVVCVLSRFSIGVTSRLCSLAVFFFIQVRFFGGTVVFTWLSRPPPPCPGGCVLTQVRKKESRDSLRGLSYLTLVKQTRAGLPNFVCVLFLRSVWRPTTPPFLLEIIYIFFLNLNLPLVHNPLPVGITELLGLNY
jgi:hypothetical protein